jgi:Xaa-Pro dipeptidase
MVPPELEEGLVVAPENEKAAADAEEAAEAMQRGADRLVETAKRLTLLLFFISSMGWSLAGGFILAGGRISPHTGFSAPLACGSPGALPALGDGTAKQLAAEQVPHFGSPEVEEWDPATFDAAAIFGDAAVVPEFVDPELLAQVDGVRAGYAHEMHIPSTSRSRLADAMPIENNAVAFLVGGKLEKRYGTSTEVLFRQESQFLYLSGFDHEEALLVVGLRSQSKMALEAGEGWLFIDRGDPVWGGGWQGTLGECSEQYDVEQCFWLEDLAETMAGLAPTSVYTLNSSDELPAGAIPPGAERVTTGLLAGLRVARVVKTEQELAVMRAASLIAVEEHSAIMQYVRCGNYESDAESLFRYVAHNYGARHQAYLPIVGSGAASALLHYNENDQQMQQGDLVLVDAAAELGATRVGGGYASDITRTWPCSGSFTPSQRAIHNVVNAMVEAGIALVVEGSSFTAASRASAETMLAGLLELGLLQGGTVEQLYTAGIHSLFMPHSLGHSVGIDVHDGGSINPFAPGMVVTVEPGIYFYQTLLTAAFGNPSQAPFLNAELLEDQYFEFGGIRLEDVVVVTAGGGPPENLSASLARSADEIEALMADGDARRAAAVAQATK